MSMDEQLLLIAEYSKHFDNITEVTAPGIVFETGMAFLLRAAILRGTPLTRPEVEAVFPDPWEEIIDPSTEVGAVLPDPGEETIFDPTA